MVILEAEHLEDLLQAVRRRGFQLIGPVVRDGAVVLDTIGGVRDLPRGWRDSQEAGSYTASHTGSDLLFDYGPGPQSWKKYLYPPVQRIWQALRKGNTLVPSGEPAPPAPLAFVGVRPCDLNAIAVQDTIFAGGRTMDPGYVARRTNLFVIAVNCVRAGGTCFCASMNTGPKASSGYDIALTECGTDGRRWYSADPGSVEGEELLTGIPHRDATGAERDEVGRTLARAAAQMGRTLDTTDIKSLFYRSYEHPRWQETGERCLGCANCTLVCPTCFCSTVEDATDLAGTAVERTRTWDSCFTLDFSYIHGGSVRKSPAARYRHWITHKLAAWIDQFGMSGCVGCGRCITWCPAEIDITEEAGALREPVNRHEENNHGKP